MKELLTIVIGFGCVMASNILLGSSLATLQKEWNLKKFLSGVYKAFAIIVCICLLYLAFYLNPNIQVVSFGGSNLNILDALKLVFTTGITVYGLSDFKKLVEIFNLKIEFKELEQKDSIKILKENIKEFDELKEEMTNNEI